MKEAEPLFPECQAGIQSIKCGLCGWEMVYACPEESELAISALAHHAKKSHYGLKFSDVDAKIEVH